MYFYKAYGLLFRCSFDLPEFITTEEAEPDVVITRGKIEHSFPEHIPAQGYFYATENEAYFAWQTIGKFLVRDGKEIIIESLQTAEERMIRLPLVGTISAVLLHQRGLLVLHSSAVAIDGKVVSFVGEKGWGKSTMAATLYGRGHILMSDDVVALDMSNPTKPMVIPGFPQFKLYPEAAAFSLGDNPETLPIVASGYDKRIRRITENFSVQSFPLTHIFVLGQGSVPEIKPLSNQESLIQLITHSYASRFGQKLLTGNRAAQHLHNCTSLIKNISIYSLERPKSLPLLSEIAQLVETQTQKIAQILV